MSRLKTFLKYFLAFIIVYLLVDIFSYMSLKSTYLKKEFKPNFDTPKIEVQESKATITNGLLNAKMTNNTDNKLLNKYLKLDFYSPRKVNVGTKYIKINELEKDETMDFSSKYNFDNVDYIECSIVDEKDVPKLADFSFDDISKNKTNWFILLGAIILLIG